MKRPFYKTRQRELIFAAIESFGDEHFTAAEAVLRTHSLGTVVAQSTMYRELERLTGEGILRRFEMGAGQSACYQRSRCGDCPEHFHLKCSECGGLMHMDCRFMRELESHFKTHHGFRLDTSKTVLYGLCEKCEGR